MLVKLPNGLLDGADLYNVAEVGEITGKQQNYLADRELVIGNIGHVPKILTDLVVSLQTPEGMRWNGNIEDAIQKLPSGDIEVLLINIRMNTYGERFYFEVECPHCQHKHSNLRIDLDTLKMEEFPLEEMLAKDKRTFKLPKCEKEVELKPIYLRDIFEVVKLSKGEGKELVTSVMALSLKRLGEKTKITPKDVEEMSMKDIMFIKDKLEGVKLEGFIDTKIESTCKSCGKDFESKLDVLSSDFFDPTKGSMNTST